MSNIPITVTEVSEINSPAHHVWGYIVTPEHFVEWNNKIVKMSAKGEFCIEQVFTTRYRMSGREIECTSTVTALRDGQLLELRHSNCTGEKISSKLTVTERITLRETGAKTIVTKEVVIRDHGIPLVFAVLIWFITRFGKPVGPDRLKQMCEGEFPGKGN